MYRSIPMQDRIAAVATRALNWSSDVICFTLYCYLHTFTIVIPS